MYITEPILDKLNISVVVELILIFYELTFDYLYVS